MSNDNTADADEKPLKRFSERHSHGWQLGTRSTGRVRVGIFADLPGLNPGFFHLKHWRKLPYIPRGGWQLRIWRFGIAWSPPESL